MVRRRSLRTVGKRIRVELDSAATKPGRESEVATVPKNFGRTDAVRSVPSNEQVGMVIQKLNPILNGWCTYFRVGNSNRTFHKVDPSGANCNSVREYSTHRAGPILEHAQGLGRLRLSCRDPALDANPTPRR